jgi:hypothetical protein
MDILQKLSWTAFVSALAMWIGAVITTDLIFVASALFLLCAAVGFAAARRNGTE